MALKTFKPTTPAQRQLVIVDRSELWAGRPVRALTVGKRKSGGRNNHGHLVNSRIGGGHKRRIRIIDFKRRKFDMPATVERLEYDPNRTAFIALIRYEDGEQSYILAPQRLRVGDQVVSGERADIKPGNALPLKNIPVGTIIHNVELKPMKGGQLARAAGTYVQLVGRDIDYALLRLGSGEVRKVHLDCLATIGAVSNPDQQNIIIGKAGRSRWFGIRPHTRGIAKNPVDHPHGGRTNGGKHWVTPSGISTKGKKTRQNKRTDGMILRRRHAAK
ncbi:MAG: 50S ribosomal protein L2 [Dongiaceae bacterium]